MEFIAVYKSWRGSFNKTASINFKGQARGGSGPGRVNRLRLSRGHGKTKEDRGGQDMQMKENSLLSDKCSLRPRNYHIRRNYKERALS